MKRWIERARCWELYEDCPIGDSTAQNGSTLLVFLSTSLPGCVLLHTIDPSTSVASSKDVLNLIRTGQLWRTTPHEHNYLAKLCFISLSLLLYFSLHTVNLLQGMMFVEQLRPRSITCIYLIGHLNNYVILTHFI